MIQLRNTIVGMLLLTGIQFGAVAQDDGQAHPSTQLQNLIYYPHKGQFLLTPQLYATIQDSSTTTNNIGVETNSSTSQYQELSLSLTYGLAPRLRIGLSESYMMTDTTSSTKLSSGAVTTSAIQGFYDPSLTASYRYYETPGDGQGLHSDVNVSVSPSLGTKLAATAGQTGTEYGSAWGLSASVPLWWVRGMQEFQLSPSITQNFLGTSNGTDPANSTQTAPYMTASVSIADRIHFCERFYLQPQLAATLPYTYSTSTQAAGSAGTDHDVGWQFTPNLTGGYLITPRILVSAYLQYTQQTNASYPTAGNSTQQNSSSTVFNLLGRFVF